MKYYKSDVNVHIHDIVKIRKRHCKGLLAMVLKKNSDTITVKCVINGFLITDVLNTFCFVQHCNVEETKYWNKLTRKLIKQTYNNYNDINYIIANFSVDKFIINNIVVNTLNKYFEVNDFTVNVLINNKLVISNIFLTGKPKKDLKQMLFDNDIIFKL